MSDYKSTTFTKISFSDPTPRVIPFGMKLKVRFFSFYFLFGSAFFLFGLPFSFVFISNSDISSLFASKDGYEKTIGVVRSINSTNSSENKRNIMEYNYTYTISQKTLDGTSYSSHYNYQAGDTITIQYDPKDAHISNIEGMRTQEFSGFLLFTLLFPGIGLVFMLVGLRLGKKNLTILTHGILSKGKFVRKERTGTKINNQMVYKIYFEFKDAQGQITQAMVKSHKPYLVQDEAEEPILYLANDPQKATMVDLLPKSVRKYLEASSF